MSNSEFVLALLNTVAFLLCVSFVSYVVMIVVPFLRHRPAKPGDGRQFLWHFIVPCLDEEAVIEDTIRTISATFPQAGIWCVDDGSADGTPGILARLARQLPNVQVVTRRFPNAQQGKGPALNSGWAAILRSLPPDTDLDRVVVGVLDADARLDPRCLDIIAGREFFGGSDVGAVQIQVRVSDLFDSDATGSFHRGSERLVPKRLLVRLQDMEFCGPIAAMQLLRRRTGSVGMGGNGQFTRLSVLNAIAREHGTPWHGALLEDLELGLHVLLNGSRTEYCHDTYVVQEGLPSIRLLIRQRSRWAQGSMQCLRYLWPVLRSPRITTQGAVEITYFLLLPWFQLLGGLIYVATTLVAGYYAFTTAGGPAAWVSGGAWGLAPLFVFFGLCPFLLWGPIYRSRTDRQLSRRGAWVVGAANWAYTYLHQVSVWWALARVLRARNDWKKTARLAQRNVPAMAPAMAGGPARMRPALPAVATRRGLYAVGSFTPRPPIPTGATVTGRLRIRPSTLKNEQDLREVA
jgi:cellulose synthase/poly-beta-1,6-N-acetylglucosamine synthase-like glycosyltransferase